VLPSALTSYKEKKISCKRHLKPTVIFLVLQSFTAFCLTRQCIFTHLNVMRKKFAEVLNKS